MVMLDRVLTLDAVPFEAFCAKRGMKVPPALTMIVPVMWQVAVDTAVIAQREVFSAENAERTPSEVPSHSSESPINVVAVAEPPLRSTLIPPDELDVV